MILKEIINKFDKSSIKAGAGLEKGQFPLYTCSPLVNKFLDDYICDEEAIVMSTGGNFSAHYVNGKFNYSTDCYVFNTDKLDLKYLYYYLISKTDDINKLFRGVGLKHLNKNEFLLMNVDNIDIKKQKEIVVQLDKIKDLIELRKKQINKCDKLIKSQFVGMFGDPYLVEEGKKIELKDIILSSNNGLARRGSDIDGNIVLRLIELQRNYLDYSNVNRISLTEKEQARYLLFDGDVLFARVNGNPKNVGRCAYYKSVGEDMYHNDHIIRVRFDLNKIHPTYLCTLLNDEYGMRELKNKIKTSAGQYTISQDGIEKIRLYLPPIELQNQFAKIVEQIDKQKFVSVEILEIIGKLSNLW